MCHVMFVSNNLFNFLAWSYRYDFVDREAVRILTSQFNIISFVK